MEEKKKKVALNDELLDKVSGGFDDYDLCEWSPSGYHEYEDYEVSPDVKGRRCKWCLLRLY